MKFSGRNLKEISLWQLCLVLAVVVILLIRYKYKERDGGESAERDREQREARQTKPDLISPTNTKGNNDNMSDMSCSTTIIHLELCTLITFLLIKIKTIQQNGVLPVPSNLQVIFRKIVQTRQQQSDHGGAGPRRHQGHGAGHDLR